MNRDRCGQNECDMKEDMENILINDQELEEEMMKIKGQLKFKKSLSRELGISPTIWDP